MIPIHRDSIYQVDTLEVKGSELLRLYDLSHPQQIQVLGAMGIGFVLGWVIAFINKHTLKENINTGYLVGVAGVLLGTAALTFFGNNHVLLGFYEFGLFIGFIVYIFLIFVFGFFDRPNVDKESMFSKFFR